MKATSNGGTMREQEKSFGSRPPTVSRQTERQSGPITVKEHCSDVNSTPALVRAARPHTGVPLIIETPITAKIVGRRIALCQISRMSNAEAESWSS
jgi:hypothetical protein